MVIESLFIVKMESVVELSRRELIILRYNQFKNMPMTDPQIFQLTGIVLFPLGLGWVIHPQVCKETIRDIAESRGMLLLSGLLALVMGYLILALHPTNSVAVTILGWVALLKGLMLIVFPSVGMEITSVFRMLKGYFVVLPWLVLFVGGAALLAGLFSF